jgi:hypothetical protein
MAKGSEGSYSCEKPPCIHVVVDWPTKKYAVFVEDAEGTLLYIPSSKIVEACSKIQELTRKRVKEASGDEIDSIAEKYLEAVELVEEEE